MSSIPYLELEPSIERQIAKNREQHVMSPFAFKDEDITRREENPYVGAGIRSGIARLRVRKVCALNRDQERLPR